MTIGLIELFKHKKSTFCLIVLACTTTGMLMGKVDGASFAAVVATLGTIYTYCQHKLDLSSNLPPRGQNG